MCLTIPSQVKEVSGRSAVIENARGKNTIDISMLPNIKKDDWILHVNKFAIRKISKKDAKEIMYLLESAKQIDLAGLSDKFKKIIEAARKRALTKDEIIYLLKTEGREKEALFSEANTIRKEYIKDFICIHGIIEFSNYCKNYCTYCGLRAGNKKIKRYRMSVEEIVKAADAAVNNKGYKLLVLQSGEDPYYTDEMLVEIITRIKEKCRVFIFVSIGERGQECYRKLKDAGAAGVLFRYETSSPKLFKATHPKGKNLENRFQHLKFMKELGYYIATGSLVGLPGQTVEDLADDILTTKEWANMVSMGPFIPMKDTPLGKSEEGGVEMNLKMIAVLRLLVKNSRIPVVTAFETVTGEEGRKRAFLAGANSLMFNLTPEKYRVQYKIYDNKFYQNEKMWEKYGLFKYEESYKMIEDRMGEEMVKN